MRIYKAKIQEQDDHSMASWGEWAAVIEQLDEELKMINESRQKVAKQLTEKDEEIDKHKKTNDKAVGDQLRKDECA